MNIKVNMNFDKLSSCILILFDTTYSIWATIKAEDL